MPTSSSQLPLVSVIIPAYNAAAFLPRAVESVLNQTYSNVEIIVVDDGSTDETPELMEDYSDSVRYIRKENGGVASARNAGIQEARGDYIAHLDADDEWMSDKLECQMALHRSNPELMWSYTNWVQVDQMTGEKIYRADQVIDNSSGDVLRLIIGRLFIPPSTKVFHREVFEKVGMYDEDELYRHREDLEFSIRVAARYPIGYLERPMVQRYLHDEKVTETMDLDKTLRNHEAIIEEAFQKYPEQLSGLRPFVTANLYTNLGRKWLDREKRYQALKMFGTAIRHHPAHVRAWLFGTAALLPRFALRGLGRLRSLFWRFTRVGTTDSS